MYVNLVDIAIENQGVREEGMEEGKEMIIKYRL